MGDGAGRAHAGLATSKIFYSDPDSSKIFYFDPDSSQERSRSALPSTLYSVPRKTMRPLACKT